MNSIMIVCLRKMIKVCYQESFKENVLFRIMLHPFDNFLIRNNIGKFDTLSFSVLSLTPLSHLSVIVFFDPSCLNSGLLISIYRYFKPVSDNTSGKSMSTTHLVQLYWKWLGQISTTQEKTNLLFFVESEKVLF